MGCCISRPTGPNSPYPAITANSISSARAINTSPPPPPPRQGLAADNDSSSQTTTNQNNNNNNNNNDNTLEPLPSSSSSVPPSSRRPRARPPPQSLAQHINKPLRRHVWATSRRTRPWTAVAIDRERTDFFDTRVAGRPEIWLTLRAALEVLWAADRAVAMGIHPPPRNDNNNDTDSRVVLQPDVEDPAVALATAQSILSAADVTLPTGDLAQGAYDAPGNYYALPEHVVSDPTNLVGLLPGALDPHAHESKADRTDGEDADTDNARLSMEAVPRPPPSQEKAATDGRDQITVRARMSEGCQDVTVTVGKDTMVRTIARRVAEQARLSANQKVRIAYMGKMLKESSPLPAQGWQHGHMVNALVFRR